MNPERVNGRFYWGLTHEGWEPVQAWRHEYPETDGRPPGKWRWHFLGSEYECTTVSEWRDMPQGPEAP